MFEYRLLPKPTASKKAKGLKTVQERFAHAMTEMLNTEGKNGWEFVGQETFSVDEKVGLRKKITQIEVTFLVFRREIVQEIIQSTDAMPLDQKLKNLRNKRERTMIQPAAAVAVAMVPEAVSAAIADAVAQESELFSEPFPEPMPAYVPEQIIEPPQEETSQSGVLPYPGGEPAQTIGGDSAENTSNNDGPTLNYDHSKSGNSASVDVPILGPARRD